MIEHKFYKFPSIEQFRHQLKALKDFIYFNGLVDDEPTFDYTRTLPTVAVNCTEKIHGTYAGVVYANNQLYAQSRNKVLAIGDDNAGFALFVEQHKTLLINICTVLKSVHNLSDSDVIVLSGEWAGGSIQKNSALSGVDKKFLIFPQFRVVHADESTSTLPISELHLSSEHIYSLANFPEATFVTTIDFESEVSINEFLALMESRIAAIEESSPVGRYFNQPNNIGEGFVCTFYATNSAGKSKQFIFKCKGEAHSNSNVIKSQSAKSTEELTALNEFVDSICHSWRFEQGVVESCGTVDSADMKYMGSYLKFVTTDTLKEENDLIIASGFEVKQIMSRVNDRAKKYFIELIKK